jgi:hypothetical protein
VSEFTFPERRFIEAEATTDEVAQLRQEFNASDVTVQRSLFDYWASGPTGLLRDYLKRLRDEGRFAIDAEVVEPSRELEPPQVESNGLTGSAPEVPDAPTDEV